jgi:membrane-associated phospholipid phosphatase
MKYNFLFVVLFFVANIGLTIEAQELQNRPNDNSSTWQTFKYDTNASWRSIKHAVTRPLHWKSKDFTKFGGMVLGTLIISATDSETSDFFRRQDESFPQPIQEFGFYFAAPQNYLMANAGLYGLGLFTKNEQIRKTSVLIISSSITAGYLQIMARTAIGRARPFSGDDPYTFKPFEGKEDYLSFPSGHTVLGVTMAHSIAKQFDNTWTKIGIYSIGSIPALTRLMDGAHWLSDVAFGAALSIVVVDSIDKFLFKSKTYDYPKKEKLISWNFRFSGNQFGFVGAF